MKNTLISSAAFLLCLLSCSSNDLTDEQLADQRFLVSQIIASNGYQKTFGSDMAEATNYYENLFALYIQDEERFEEILKFLVEDGTSFTKINPAGFRFSKIIGSNGYKLAEAKQPNSDISILRLLVKGKITYIALVNKSKIGCFTDLKTYQALFDSFSLRIKKIPK